MKAVPLILLAIIVGGCRSVSTQPSPTDIARTEVRDKPVPIPSQLAQAEVDSPAVVRAARHVALADEPPQPMHGVLSLHDLDAMALQNNPSVSEAAARVDALRGKWYQVGLKPNPEAGYIGSEIGNEGQAGQQGAFVGQEFVTGGKLRLNRQAASWEVQRAEQQLIAQEQRVRTDVRLGFYEVLIAQRREKLAEELAGIGGRGAESVDALFKAKEASRPELLQARVEADSAKILAANARTARQAAWRKLAAVLGRPDLPETTVVGELVAEGSNFDFESFLGELRARHPSLLAARAEIERARWAVQRAQVEPSPNVTAQASVQYDDASRYTIAGVQIGMPLPIYNRNQGGIQQALFEAVAAERAAERIELSLLRRAATVRQRYEIAQEQVRRYGQEILPNVKTSLDLVNEGYRAGEFNFLQLLTAQRTYFQANLTYLDAVGDLWAARSEFDGLLLSDSLGPGGID